MAQRARIVLLASEGLRNAEIADRVGVSRPTVNVWRSRYVDAGMAGLVDVDRPGRPKTVDQRKIIAETCGRRRPGWGLPIGRRGCSRTG